MSVKSLQIVISVLLAFICHPVVLMLQVFVSVITSALWRMNGTDAEIAKSRTPECYGMSVHVMTIWGRHKLDNIMPGNFVSDFFLSHEGFQQPQYLLRREVSLYCITPREFVFVECAEGTSAWDVRDYSFSREGQFRKAKRVLVLPVQAAHRLARDVGGRPKENLILIHNTARCGSTLACQIFQATGKCIVYTEPYAINDLMKNLRNIDNDVISAELVSTTITLLCPPLRTQSAVAHVLKLQPQCGEVIEHITNLLPDTDVFFMYRDVKASSLSLAKAFMHLPGCIFHSVCAQLNTRLFRWFSNTHGYNGPTNPTHLAMMVRPQAPVVHAAVMALVTIRHYLDLRATGLDVHGVRFEDLVAKPADVVAAMFDLCRLDGSLVERALGALDRDAQENSPLSQDKVRHGWAPPYTDGDDAEIRKACWELDLPIALGDFILPGTIRV